MVFATLAAVALSTQTYVITNDKGLHEVDGQGHVLRTITRRPAPQARLIPKTNQALAYRAEDRNVVAIDLKTGEERVVVQARTPEFYIFEDAGIETLQLHCSGAIHLLSKGTKACIRLDADPEGKSIPIVDIEVDLRRKTAQARERDSDDGRKSPCGRLGDPFANDPILKSLDGTAGAHLGPQQQPAYREHSTSPSGRWTLFWQFTSPPRAMNFEEVTRALYLRDNSTGGYHIVPLPGEPWPPVMSHDDMKLREDPNAGYWTSELHVRVNTPKALDVTGTEPPLWMGQTDKLVVNSVLIEPGVRTVDLGGRIVH